MTAAKQRRRSAGRPEPSWRIRAIRRDPLDPRLLARLFIQMALERSDTQGPKADATSEAVRRGS